MVNYTLFRSSRKTLGIYIRNGVVEVRAPLKTPKGEIERFVLSKDTWIKEKLALSCAETAQRDSFRLTYGHLVSYRGNRYPIAEKPGNRIGFDDKCFYMPPGLAPEQIIDACSQIYRLLAKRDLTKKTVEFAKKMSVEPLAVKINGAKARWGSCSSKKSINFSWLLIMADDDIVDYVVVHELAHITEMNHSPSFWALVGSVLPDYKERKSRLRDFQRKLSAENW